MPVEASQDVYYCYDLTELATLWRIFLSLPVEYAAMLDLQCHYRNFLRSGAPSMTRVFLSVRPWENNASSLKTIRDNLTKFCMQV